MVEQEGRESKSQHRKDRPRIPKAQKPNFDWKKMKNPMMVEKGNKKKAPMAESVDYLQMQRHKREENFDKNGSTRQSHAVNWNREIEKDGMSKKEKFDIIKDRAKVLEEEANRMEQKVRLNHGSVDQAHQIDENIIESIKAKLALLDDI